MDFFTRLGEILICQYIPIAIPYLFVLILESVSSLALWHAAQQTAKPKILVCADGDTESLNSKLSRSLKKVAVKTRDESRLVILFVVLVTALQQFLEYKSSRLNGYGSPASNYYLRASRDLNDLTWADILFLSTLSLPTVKIICRILGLLFGIQFRLVIRDYDGHPFAVVRKSPNARPRWRALLLLLSISTTVAAFWFRNKYAIGIVNAAMTHLFVSGIPTVKSTSLKSQLWAILFLIVCAAFSGALLIASVFMHKRATPIRLLEIYTTSEVNWASFFLSMIFSLWPIKFISFCYRLDSYLLSSAESSLVKLPKVKLAIPGANAIYGTAVMISNAKKLRLLFPLRYSIAYAALLGWLCGYVALAAIVANDFLTVSWETSSFTAGVLAAPMMLAFVFIAAALRGELRRMWSYNEVWGVAPDLEDEHLQELREKVASECRKETTNVEKEGVTLSKTGD